MGATLGNLGCCELSAGDVDDLLPRLRQAIGALGIRQRPRLIDPVQIAARQAVRLTLIQIRPSAHMAVSQRGHRLRPRQQVQVQMSLRQAPRLHGECVLQYH